MLKSAVGVYTASGNILCDCHKIEQKVFRFVDRCAGNQAHRPYQATFVELRDGSTVSLKELVDGAGGLHTKGPSREPTVPSSQSNRASAQIAALPAGWELPEGWEVTRKTREGGTCKVVLHATVGSHRI